MPVIPNSKPTNRQTSLGLVKLGLSEAVARGGNNPKHAVQEDGRVRALDVSPTFGSINLAKQPF